MFWSGPNFEPFESHNFEESEGGLNRACYLGPKTTETEWTFFERSKCSNFRRVFEDAEVTATTSKTPLTCECIELCDTPQLIRNDPDLKHLVKVFVIDIETTGFCRRKGRIIEIVFRDVLGGENSSFHTLVRPE